MNQNLKYNLTDSLIYNVKSLNYTTIWLKTSWAISSPANFNEIYKSYGGDCIKIDKLREINPFVSQLVFTNWRIFVIEIYKIFDENSKQGIRKILNKLINKEPGFKLDNYNREKIQDIINLYDSRLVEFEGTLSRIKTLRDKFYAHRDEEFFTRLDTEVKFVEGNALNEFAKDMLTKIGELCGEDIQFMTEAQIYSKIGLEELILLSKGNVLIN